MHLRSECAQTVSIRDAHITCRFTAGETIWTEACHKYRLEELPALAARTGYVCAGRWVDEEWPFAESLFLVNAAEDHSGSAHAAAVP
jgi:uncharacterized SAM-dependent methyltransferase